MLDEGSSDTKVLIRVLEIEAPMKVLATILTKSHGPPS